MKKSIAALALVAGLVLGSTAPAHAGAAENAALALGAFAVLNQIVGGDTIFHGLYRSQQPVAVAPPPLVYAPPPPPPVMYAPPPVVSYPHGHWVWRGAWVWVPQHSHFSRPLKHSSKPSKHHWKRHAW